MRLAIDRLKGWIARRPPSTEGHTETARETGVALGLMAQAADAVEPTPEQQIFLSQAEHGMRERLSMLLGIPHRSLAQEREKLAIEQWLSRKTPENGESVGNTGGVIPRRFLGPLMAANPLAGVLMSPALWVAAAFAIPAAGAAIQTARLHHAKADLAEARETAEHNAQAVREWRDRYTHDMADAIHTAQAAAQALDTERATRARQAAAERRRLRDLQNVLAHSDSAPEWRLRDPEPPASGEPPASP